MSRKGRRIALIVFLSIIILIILFFVLMAISFVPVNSKDETKIVLKVPEKTGKSVIAEQLKDTNLIRNAFFLKVYMAFTRPTLYAGTYTLSPSMSALDILDKMEKQDNLESETVSITFIEGKQLSNFVNKIVENFDYTEEEVYKYLNDSEFLTKLIDKYWFLSNDILNSEIYNPLEGYIYPDTYEFKKTSTIEEIITKTLDNMSYKLEQYKEEIELSNYSVHQILTLASIIELEASDAGVENNDNRANIAGVFYNRLNAGWTLGSDVTTYYAAKKDITEDLTYDDINSCNAYNTRSSCVKGLPVGPIDSPSLSSIVATLEPIQNDYYYFVADTDKNIYFSKTGVEHNKKVAELKAEGKWLGY